MVTPWNLLDGFYNVTEEDIASIFMTEWYEDTESMFLCNIYQIYIVSHS
jgi:hypothetical protein